MSYKILVVPAYKLFPITTGGAHGQLTFLDKQQHKQDITLVLTPDNIDAADIPEFQKEFPHLHILPIGFKKKRSRTRQFIRKQIRKFSGRDAVYHLWKTPFLDSVIIRDESVLIDIVDYLNQHHFDLVQIEFARNLGLVSVIPPNIKKIFVHHEMIHPRIKEDMEALKYASSYAQYITNLMEAVEIYSLQQYDGIITFNADDKTLLHSKGVTKPIQVAGTFALFESELEKIYSPVGPQSLLFMGNEEHFPNKEGLTWFLEEIFPIILEANPDIILKVTGKWTDEFKTKYKKSSVVFTGFVEDLDPLLKESISISPIRIGSGIRIKIITSMAKGLPVVSTTLGASGIPGIIHQENIMIADDAQSFAACVLQLVNQPELREKLSEQCYQLSYKNYTALDYAADRNNFYTKIIEG